MSIEINFNNSKQTLSQRPINKKPVLNIVECTVKKKEIGLLFYSSIRLSPDKSSKQQRSIPKIKSSTLPVKGHRADRRVGDFYRGDDRARENTNSRETLDPVATFIECASTPSIRAIRHGIGRGEEFPSTRKLVGELSS